MGTLEAGAGQGQGEHLQGGADRTGPGTPETWRGRASWPWPRHSARPLPPKPYYPPKKNPWGTYGSEHRNKAIHRNRHPPWAKLGI